MLNYLIINKLNEITKLQEIKKQMNYIINQNAKTQKKL